MPFDAAKLDATTQLLLKLRDRLTPENWRPHASNAIDFNQGRGCLLQQLTHAGAKRFTAGEQCEAFERLRNAAGVACNVGLSTFNDTHTLEEVQAVVDKAIGG